MKGISAINILPRLLPGLKGGEQTETKLITAAQKGSRQAFDALVRTYERPLRGFVSCRVGPGAADDVLQETWIAGWLALPRYSRRSRFKAWLFAIACHKCTDHYRAHGRLRSEAPLEEADQAGFCQPDDFAAADLRHTVRSLLPLLTVDQRDVIEMYYYGELTLAEIALALDRNLNTIKAQFYRAHARIEQDLNALETSGMNLKTARKG
jgi:RNA polymerase sigma-70 factor (ECF subfamily)